jgi:hypothetical protein
MKIISVLVAAMLLPATAVAQADGYLAGHQRALYAGDFAKAHRLLDVARDASASPTMRFLLLTQRVRTQQIARLSGRPDPAETSTLARLQVNATAEMPEALLAEARFVALVSTYFRRLTKVEEGDFLSLQPGFDAAARQMLHPCKKADAQFFSALMTQMSGKVLESAAGLGQARAAAAAGRCDMELSYSLRHLAVVAEEQGDLEKAARLAQEGLALRRKLKFEVFLPYSLLHCADVAQKRGDQKGAQAFRKEVLQIAQRLKLPAQTGAARAAMAL